jgi:leader peptidase (prepilin peptidase) / N-methyltransferase
MSLETFVLWLDVTAFVWGAIWGSFLNVVIYRLPAGLSLVKPPSRCPKCETQLRWYDNIPIFGWLFLRGRCRYCKNPVSARYPGVELLTALLSLWIWYHVAHGPLATVTVDEFGDVLLAVGMAFFFYFYFVAILIAITFIDLDETIIPHELTGAGVVLGVIAAFLIPTTGPMVDLWPGTTWVDALLGVLVGGGVIFGVIKGYALVRGIEGMGWGDFTLMAMVGAWVGWRGIVFVLFGAAMQGLLITLGVAGVNKLRGKPGEEGGFFISDVDAIDADPEELAAARAAAEADGIEADEPGFAQLAVPFGPFIALAAVEYLLLGHLVLPWFFDA